MKTLALWQRPVSYGAVGATQAADLLQYPPAGFRPIERRVRIGYGDARWDYAWTQLLTWGLHRLSGLRVQLSDSPAAVTDLSYTPVLFDEDGNPMKAATVDEGEEQIFAPDGSAFIKPGDTAMLTIPIGPLRFTAPVRVVYVIDEPKRKGFGYGTLVGHPESGEECWIVERTDDGSVWLTIRAFSRPSRWFWWPLYPATRLVQAAYTRRYERALAGPIAE